MLKTKKPKKHISRIHHLKKVKKTLSGSGQQNSNICNTCIHKDGCTLSSSSTPIQYCEEFDGGITPQRKTMTPHVTVEKDTVQYESHMGLCATCIHKDDCSLSKVEGGVWHCEEYE
jgi:hypothetical protein